MKPLKDEYKVIIWGLGSVGRSALQIINAKSSLRLVAAYDIDPKKIGRDAGEVCGFEPAGVIVTNVSLVLLAIYYVIERNAIIKGKKKEIITETT